MEEMENASNRPDTVLMNTGGLFIKTWSRLLLFTKDGISLMTVQSVCVSHTEITPRWDWGKRRRDDLTFD